MISFIHDVLTPRFNRSPAARKVEELVESYENRPESVTIDTHRASAVTRSIGHSFHFAKRQRSSPVEDASGSAMVTSANVPLFVTWWSMHIFGSDSATGLTSGGILSKPLLSTATSRLKGFWRRSFRTWTMSSTPSRKSSFPSAFKSAVATASCPAARSILASAIMLPRESPSGLLWPDTSTLLAPEIIRAAAAKLSLSLFTSVSSDVPAAGDCTA